MVCYINGQLFGRVADVGWSESTPRKEMHVVDYLPPWELIQQLPQWELMNLFLPPLALP